MNSSRRRKGPGAAQAAERDPTVLAHAVELIFRTCCLAGAPSVITKGAPSGPFIIMESRNDTPNL
jgi:hypothetical protein